jgi:hypothetical protein
VNDLLYSPSAHPPTRAVAQTRLHRDWPSGTTQVVASARTARSSEFGMHSIFDVHSSSNNESHPVLVCKDHASRKQVGRGADDLSAIDAPKQKVGRSLYAPASRACALRRSGPKHEGLGTRRPQVRPRTLFAPAPPTLYTACVLWGRGNSPLSYPEFLMCL